MHLQLLIYYKIFKISFHCSFFLLFQKILKFYHQIYLNNKNPRKYKLEIFISPKKFIYKKTCFLVVVRNAKFVNFQNFTHVDKKIFCRKEFFWHQKIFVFNLYCNKFLRTKNLLLYTSSAKALRMLHDQFFRALGARKHKYL